jgi:hypothetical protein
MRDYRTYAIRLAVEGGGQVKAELVSVGQSGEQSLKRIESAGNRASGGLKGLGRQAELLRPVSARLVARSRSNDGRSRRSACSSWAWSTAAPATASRPRRHWPTTDARWQPWMRRALR